MTMDQACRRAIALASLVSTVLFAPSAATAAQTNAFTALKSSYEWAGIEIGQAYVSREKATLKQYGKALDGLLAALKQKGDIDTYDVIEAEKKRLSTEGSLPDTTNSAPALADSIKASQKAIADAKAEQNRQTVILLKKYVTALDGLIKQSMQANKMEEARAIKTEREKAASELADLEARLPQIAKQGFVSETKPAEKGKTLTLDLGGGVKMEFVWIAALKGWVGKYEVTNEEYRRFKAGHDSKVYEGKTLNDERQPVLDVSYDDAVAFAEWVNGQRGIPKGYRVRLPDGKEWTTFAQCGDGREYPWGHQWPPKYGNYSGQESAWTGSKIDGYNDGCPVTCAVEASGKNDWGLYGVGGNASEWTSEERGAGRVLRSVHWAASAQDHLRCAFRGVYAPSGRNISIGFRVVLLR